MGAFRSNETGELHRGRVTAVTAIVAGFSAAVILPRVFDSTRDSIRDESAKRAFVRQYIVEDDCLKDSPYDPATASVSVEQDADGTRSLYVSPTDTSNPIIRFAINGTFPAELTPAGDSATIQVLETNNCPI